MVKIDCCGTCTAILPTQSRYWKTCCCSGHCHQSPRPNCVLGGNRMCWICSSHERCQGPCPSQRSHSGDTTNSHRTLPLSAAKYLALRQKCPTYRLQTQARSMSLQAVSELHHKTPFSILRNSSSTVSKVAHSGSILNLSGTIKI